MARLETPSVTDLLLLSPEELDRARRLPDDRVRGRWVASRAFLRRTLAPAVRLDPADLMFDYSATGRPSLAGGPDFNLAHSGGCAVLATCAAARVGADVERVSEKLAAPPSVERWFSSAERAELARLPEAGRARRFFELWTLREAYLKATGEGIGPGRLAELPATGWVFERPPAPAGYAAAVVVLAPSAVFEFAGAPVWS